MSGSASYAARVVAWCGSSADAGSRALAPLDDDDDDDDDEDEEEEEEEEEEEDEDEDEDEEEERGAEPVVVEMAGEGVVDMGVQVREVDAGCHAIDGGAHSERIFQ